MSNEDAISQQRNKSDGSTSAAIEPSNSLSPETESESVENISLRESTFDKPLDVQNSSMMGRLSARFRDGFLGKNMHSPREKSLTITVSQPNQTKFLSHGPRMTKSLFSRSKDHHQTSTDTPDHEHTTIGRFFSGIQSHRRASHDSISQIPVDHEKNELSSAFPRLFTAFSRNDKPDALKTRRSTFFFAHKKSQGDKQDTVTTASEADKEENQSSKSRQRLFGALTLVSTKNQAAETPVEDVQGAPSSESSVDTKQKPLASLKDSSHLFSSSNSILQTTSDSTEKPSTPAAIKSWLAGNITKLRPMKNKMETKSDCSDVSMTNIPLADNLPQQSLDTNHFDKLHWKAADKEMSNAFIPGSSRRHSLPLILSSSVEQMAMKTTKDTHAVSNLLSIRHTLDVNNVDELPLSSRDGNPVCVHHNPLEFTVQIQAFRKQPETDSGSVESSPTSESKTEL